MQHLSRIYQVLSAQYEDPAHAIPTIARQLVYGILPPCSCFRVGPLLLCNDSPSEQTPQQYAIFVIDDECGYQIGDLDAPEIDSITFSECRPADAQVLLTSLLHRAQTRTYDSRGTFHLRLEHRRHTCPLCA